MNTSASTTAAGADKKTVAVWKFTSCDGCQLSLLDCEDELLTLTSQVDLAYFKEASSREQPGPYDLSIVEGSISTPQQQQEIRAIREQSRFLLVIGACATAGGIQALRNIADIDEYTRLVYAKPDIIETLATSTPISDHVAVDFELRGCPINKQQLLEVISALLHQRQPQISRHSVCMECKLSGTVCLSVSRGEACMGPVTQAGCGALCPRYNRPCFGCYGPKENPNPDALTDWWHNAMGVDSVKIIENLSNFNNHAPAFRDAANKRLADRDSD